MDNFRPGWRGRGGRGRFRGGRRGNGGGGRRGGGGRVVVPRMGPGFSRQEPSSEADLRTLLQKFYASQLGGGSRLEERAEKDGSADECNQEMRSASGHARALSGHLAMQLEEWHDFFEVVRRIAQERICPLVSHFDQDVLAEKLLLMENEINKLEDDATDVVLLTEEKLRNSPSRLNRLHSRTPDLKPRSWSWMAAAVAVTIPLGLLLAWRAQR